MTGWFYRAHKLRKKWRLRRSGSASHGNRSSVQRLDHQQLSVGPKNLYFGLLEEPNRTQLARLKPMATVLALADKSRFFHVCLATILGKG